MEDRRFFRAHIETGHERQEENSKGGEREPDAGDVSGDRRRLIFVDARRFGGSAGKPKGVPDFPAVQVLADGPGDFLVELLAGQDAGWMHVVGDDGVLADANLPGKFAEDKICVGVGRLEMLVGFAQVINGASLVRRKLLANTDVVPMSVIFAEVANALVRIEQDVFVPAVGDSVDLGAAPLKPDDFVVRAAQLAARTQGNEGPYATRFNFELLEDGEVGSLASRMQWQLPQTTVSACPNERSVMAAPHFGQFSAFACGFGGPESGGMPAPITSPRSCADFSI